MMELTDDFDEMNLECALRDTEFREGLLIEGIECMLAGEVKVGELFINDYNKATKELNKRSGNSKKSKAFIRTERETTCDQNTCDYPIPA